MDGDYFEEGLDDLNYEPEKQDKKSDEIFENLEEINEKDINDDLTWIKDYEKKNDENIDDLSWLNDFDNDIDNFKDDLSWMKEIKKESDENIDEFSRINDFKEGIDNDKDNLSNIYKLEENIKEENINKEANKYMSQENVKTTIIQDKYGIKIQNGMKGNSNEINEDKKDLKNIKDHEQKENKNQSDLKEHQNSENNEKLREFDKVNNLDTLNKDLLSLKLKQTYQEYHILTNLNANSGLKFTQKFKRFIQDNNNLTGLEKEQLKYTIEKIENENQIEKYILHLLSSTTYTIEKIIKSVKETEGLTTRYVTVKNIEKKYDLEIRETYRDSQIHPYLIKDYFKTIDTKEKAYFLGFLYADG